MSAVTGSELTHVTPPFCIADDATFWPGVTWADFARWPDKGATVVCVPVAGMADWGLGHAMDIEETLAMSILKAASELVGADAGFKLLVLPPLRFVSGSDAGCAFVSEPPETHRYIDEVVASVAAAGFTRVVFYNASPWNEELVDAAGRDIRIARGLQMFCVNLSALGYDLHPTRSKTRRAAQTLMTYLSGVEPEPVCAAEAGAAKVWPEAEAVGPLAEPAATLAEAMARGPEMLAVASRRLSGLLGEIAARAPLPHGGAILPMRA
jgi:creatinine amidohydrolase